MFRRILTAACLAAALATATVVAPASAHAPSGEPDTSRQLAEVRQATARYHDLEQAVADGYGLASPCVPGMGYHYVKSIADDASGLQPTEPNILVYAPQPNGKTKLVAVEYASWSPASLFGREFDAPGADGPPFYTLHAWVWHGNPDGIFTATNRTVSCGD